ncbi:DUF5008 domain-containing protein [Pedobacter heparinus]|uniref:DUF5008 domain-containing protein n=1 Tax=Pedobacter heparinus TaxID=984 RepID=UPI00293028FB|nr:DUF5008 domain-containing protein [Pedobacter heparinus]
MFVACQKNEVKLQDPYAGGKASLGIEFSTKAPYPAVASAGETVEINVKGLKKYEGKFKLYVNELEAEIVELTTDLIRFKVPQDASTGGVWVTLSNGTANLDNQTYFGPALQIAGKVSIEPSFAVVNGSDYPINDIFRVPSGSFLLGGAFLDYEKTKTESSLINRIVLVNALGVLDNSLKFGLGANGVIYSINRITSGDQNGKILIGGAFSSFNSRRSNRININSITRLNVDGTLDTTFTDVVNLTPNDPTKNRDTIPAFNGGVNTTGNTRGPLVRRLFNFNNRVYAVGNFNRYAKTFYERSTYDTKVYDYTSISQVVRMEMDGSMDSTYRYDKSSKVALPSSNGSIVDALQLADGSLVLVGDFTSFDNTNKNRIVKLKAEGTVDETFATGTGANGPISSITYNAITNKIVVAGNFTSFNGQPLMGVALLNTDGTISSGFTFPSISGGVVTFAAQLNNGKIIVSGSFDHYRNILRQGFMVLENNGTLASGYNNTGIFAGTVYDMLEVVSPNGYPAVFLVGNISRFNNNIVHNIVKVEIQN